MSNNFWEPAIKRTCKNFGIKDDFSHQWINSTWIFRKLKTQDGVLLGDGVGTGKTYSALFGALQYYARNAKFKKFNNTSILIICPNKAVESKWWRDIFHIDPNKPNLIDYVKNIKEGKRKKKLKKTINAFLDESNVVYLRDIHKKRQKEKLKRKIIFATTHDIHAYFKSKSKNIKDLEKIIQIVIIDEAHKLKQRKFQEITKEREFLPDSKKIFLTATPFQKEAHELGKLLKLINKENDAKDFECYRDQLDSAELKKLKATKVELEKRFREYVAVTVPNKKNRIKDFINGNLVDEVGIASIEDLFKHLGKIKPIDANFYLKYLKKRAEDSNDDNMLVYQGLSLFLSKYNKDVEGKHPKVELLSKILRDRFSIASDNFCCKPVIFAGMNVGSQIKKEHTAISGLHKYLKEIVTNHYQAQLKKYCHEPSKSKLPNFNSIIERIVDKLHAYTDANRHLIKALNSSIKKLSTVTDRLFKALGSSELYRFYVAHEKTKKIKGHYEKEFKSIAKQYCDCCLTLCNEGYESQFIKAEDYDSTTYNNFMERRKKHLWETLEAMLPGNNLVETYSSRESHYSRKKSLEAFQSPLEPFVLIVSNAGAEGLDMQNYTKGCIHYDMTWAPGIMVQRNGRVNRIGKKSPKKQAIENHYLIIPNTYDERIFAALQKRMKALSLMIPIDVESKTLFVDVDQKKAGKLSFDLKPRIKVK